MLSHVSFSLPVLYRSARNNLFYAKMAVDWPEKALMKPDFDLQRLQDIFKSRCHPDVQISSCPRRCSTAQSISLQTRLKLVEDCSLVDVAFIKLAQNSAQVQTSSSGTH